MREGRTIFSAAEKIKAFTLSEVLIALMILGIIAMLVIPGMIKKSHHRAYEVGFKKAWSMTNQAVQIANYQTGTNNLAQNGAPYTEQINALYKAFGIDTQNTGYVNSGWYNYTEEKNTRKTYPVKNFAGGTYVCVFVCPNSKMYKKGDMLIGIEQGNNYTIVIGIDTNGTAPPNRLGYDIWKFCIIEDRNNATGLKSNMGLLPIKILGTNGKIKTSYCNNVSDHGANTFTCGYYALINQNPNNPEQTYWDGLD